MSAQLPVPTIWSWFPGSPYDENLLNICPELAMRNLYHHDRWGSANSFGDFLLVSNLDLWWSQWISESSAQENMSSKAYLRVVWIAWQSRTAFTCFHRHVCLLAFFVLCASTRMALFCSPCDEYFAEYFYWSRSAESLPPWSLRACELIWRCFGCLLNVVFRKWQDRVFEFGKMLKTPRRAVFCNVIDFHVFVFGIWALACPCDWNIWNILQ